MSSQTNYWVVGVTLDGENATRTFLDRGYWQLGTGSKQITDARYAERLAQIKIGDRIAMKSLVGKGTALINVHAIGVVRDVEATERRVYVKWWSFDESRSVALRGCLDAINGPYNIEGEYQNWISEIFRI